MPFSFASFLLTALWLVWRPDEHVMIVKGIGVAMFSIWMVIVGYFFSRVVYNLKTVSTHHLDPYT